MAVGSLRRLAISAWLNIELEDSRVNLIELLSVTIIIFCGFLVGHPLG
jgi:hypothetical protein